MVPGPVRRRVRRPLRRRWTLSQAGGRFDHGGASNAQPGTGGRAEQWTATDDQTDGGSGCASTPSAEQP